MPTAFCIRQMAPVRNVTTTVVLLESAVRVPTVDIIILTPIVSIKKLTVRYTKVLYTVCLCAQHPAVIPCSQNNIWCQMTHSTVRLVTTSSTVLIPNVRVFGVSFFILKLKCRYNILLIYIIFCLHSSRY